MPIRGAYKKSEASRRQVLDAAVRTLAERGYAGTSIGDIARAAGMSKGAVHYHFESKHDLIGQVLEHCAAAMRARVHSAWEAPAEPAEKVRRALAEMRGMRREGIPELRVLADLMAQGLHDPGIRDKIAAMFAANRSEVVEHLMKSLRDFGLEPVLPPEVAARLLLGALDGLALHDFFDPPKPGEDEALQEAVERIALSLLRQ
jgi:AcrR family transcriptional regulator